MKLLVISDSHKNIDRMQYAAQQVMPDAILHLGDHIADAHELQRRLPNTVIHTVVGNCDFYAAGEDELLLTLEGVKIYMTHGHNFGVKQSLSALMGQARRKGADLVLFGHTHQALMQQTNGLWLMNPGQIGRNDSICAASYGVVSVEGGVVEWGIRYLGS